MLKGRIGNGTVVTHGFLLGMEVDGYLDVEVVINKLAECVMSTSHVGQVDVEYLGELDLIKEDEEEGDNVMKGVNPQKGRVRES